MCGNLSVKLPHEEFFLVVSFRFVLVLVFSVVDSDLCSATMSRRKQARPSRLLEDEEVQPGGFPATPAVIGKSSSDLPSLLVTVNGLRICVYIDDWIAAIMRRVILTNLSNTQM